MHFGNHNISNLISKINYGAKKRLRFIIIDYNDTVLKLLEILYINGALRSYKISNNKVYVYYKYYLCNIAVKLSIVSTPGNRVFWSLGKLSTYYNRHNFSGFYIISTQKGLYTSDYCLIKGLTGGEILLKVEV